MSFRRLTKARLSRMPGLLCLAVIVALNLSPSIARTPASESSAGPGVLEPRVFAHVAEAAWLKERADSPVVFPLFPKDKKDKKNKHGEDEHGGKGSGSVQVMFGKRDPEIIRSYYAGQGSGLPPGLEKRGGDLPPGLEKQLRRNGQLPPGLQKKLVPFPVELERRLPPLPPNYVRVFVGGRGLIVDAQFHIMDVVMIFK